MKSIKIEVPAKIILTCVNFTVMNEEELGKALLAAEMALNDVGVISHESAGGAGIGIRVHMDGSIKETSVREAFKQLAIAAEKHSWGDVRDIVGFIEQMKE